ncbi:MAG: hypothetical protein Q9188_006242, partial [Gyalolechia gomerana]
NSPLMDRHWKSYHGLHEISTPYFGSLSPTNVKEWKYSKAAQNQKMIEAGNNLSSAILAYPRRTAAGLILQGTGVNTLKIPITNYDRDARIFRMLERGHAAGTKPRIHSLDNDRIGQLGDVNVQLLETKQEANLALAHVNFDFSLAKHEALTEFQGLDASLSKQRKMEAEDGSTHIVPRKLGALFASKVSAFTQAYSRCVTEIAEMPPVKSKGRKSDGAFADLAGAEVRRIIGNIGKPGLAVLIAPRIPKMRGLRYNEWNVIAHRPFEGQLEDSFTATSLHLSMTGYQLPLNTGSHAYRQCGGSRNEISKCAHSAAEQKDASISAPLASVDSWIELLDRPYGYAIVRTHGNQSARLVAATVAAQKGYPFRIIPPDCCWRCEFELERGKEDRLSTPQNPRSFDHATLPEGSPDLFEVDADPETIDEGLSDQSDHSCSPPLRRCEQHYQFQHATCVLSTKLFQPYVYMLDDASRTPGYSHHDR